MLKCNSEEKAHNLITKRNTIGFTRGGENEGEKV